MMEANVTNQIMFVSLIVFYEALLGGQYFFKLEMSILDLKYQLQSRDQVSSFKFEFYCVGFVM